MSARPSVQRGATLLEIMIALAVVLLGVMGLFRVLGAASQGSASAQQFTQATARGRSVIEVIRSVPTPILHCLADNPANQWATCEDQCMLALGTATPDACVFVSLQRSQQATDRTRQAYQVVFDASQADRSSWVRRSGASGRVFDIQITTGWNENGNAAPVQHRVTLRTSVFR